MSALLPASEIVTRRRICADCREVELEPAASGELCAGCVLDYERHRDAMREQAQVLEGNARDRCRCGICSAWRGPAPLGGLRARCRKVREMREARA